MYAMARSLFPQHNIVHNSVKMPFKQTAVDSLISHGPEDYSQKEDGLVSGHKNLTCEGDTVVIIGGGSGVTTVNAARITSSKGEVQVFEASTEQVDIIQETLLLNNVHDWCRVNNTIVGGDRGTFRNIDTKEADLLDVADLPECDVLEIDADGGEIDILRDLSISPRVILIELHPYFFPNKEKEIFQFFSDNGYEIVHMAGHDGTLLNKSEFEKLYQKSLKYGAEYGNSDTSQSEHRFIDSGARWPVVVGVERKIEN
jgi:hypothetical protein